MIKKIMVTCGIFSTLFFLLSAPVFAQTPLNTAILGPGSETETLLKKFLPAGADLSTIKTPGALVFGIVQIILGFLGIVVVIMMIYGGFLWVTAGGEEDKAKKGSTILFQAAIGAVIVLASYTITYFVLYQLTTVVTQ